ncbi:ATP-binding protein, partial [Patescibacteria group bacterium]|nr:ATP-binding protein [Patescibacteria group bacterium]
ISISIEAESNFAKIIIKDTGTGISDENKKLLFRKFQRTGSNLLTRQEGTGLGLHLANLLIAKMGGTINIERTEINKGSTFSFTIPIFNN